MRRPRLTPGLLQRRLLATLRQHGGRPVSMAVLVEAVYGDDPPEWGGPSLRTAIQRYNALASDADQIRRTGEYQCSRWHVGDQARPTLWSGRFAPGAMPRAAR